MLQKKKTTKVYRIFRDNSFRTVNSFYIEIRFVLLLLLVWLRPYAPRLLYETLFVYVCMYIFISFITKKGICLTCSVCRVWTKYERMVLTFWFLSLFKITFNDTSKKFNKTLQSKITYTRHRTLVTSTKNFHYLTHT